MIEFEGWRVPPGFRSDGCTFAPDSWFGRDLKPACVLHDFLRRHGVIPVPEADKLFRRHLIALGAPAWLARIYWLVVKLTRPWFSAVRPLPGNWAEYGYRRRHYDR